MTGDGHTKGSIDRAALREVASGILVSNYACKPLKPPPCQWHDELSE